MAILNSHEFKMSAAPFFLPKEHAIHKEQPQLPGSLDAPVTSVADGCASQGQSQQSKGALASQLMSSGLDSLTLDNEFTPSTPYVHKFRTELCKNFQMYGKCKFGDEVSKHTAFSIHSYLIPWMVSNRFDPKFLMMFWMTITQSKCYSGISFKEVFQCI